MDRLGTEIGIAGRTMSVKCCTAFLKTGDTLPEQTFIVGEKFVVAYLRQEKSGKSLLAIVSEDLEWD